MTTAPDSAEAERPLAGITFSLAGPGRVGSSLATWLTAAGGRLQQVAGRDPAGRAAELARRLGGQAVPLAELASAGHDLLLVAVPDPALDAVAAELASRPPAAVALHTAGSRGSEALAPLAAAGAAAGSFHPLKAFGRELSDPAQARDVMFALDGPPPALALGRRLAAAWGGVAVEVPPGARLLYHFAATLAAGGVVTLVAEAAELARRLGLPPAVGRGFIELARGALEAAAGAGDPIDAITGPVARGDLATVRAQHAALAEVSPRTADLARRLAVASLRRIAGRRPLDRAQGELLAELETEVG